MGAAVQKMMGQIQFPPALVGGLCGVPASFVVQGLLRIFFDKQHRIYAEVSIIALGLVFGLLLRKHTRRSKFTPVGSIDHIELIGPAMVVAGMLAMVEGVFINDFVRIVRDVSSKFS